MSFSKRFLNFSIPAVFELIFGHYDIKKVKKCQFGVNDGRNCDGAKIVHHYKNNAL